LLFDVAAPAAPLAVGRRGQVFHSADDVIYPVACADRLVRSLRSVGSNKETVRYSRFDRDQEGFSGAVRGHSTGITASKDPEVYEWLLSLGPRGS